MAKAKTKRALQQLEWSANRDSKGSKLRPGTWVSVCGEAQSSGKLWTKRFVKCVWFGRIEEELSGGYLVRYANKVPRNKHYVGKKVYFAPERSVIEPVDNVAQELGWQFSDSLAMLGAAAAIAL